MPHPKKSKRDAALLLIECNRKWTLSDQRRSVSQLKHWEQLHGAKIQSIWLTHPNLDHRNVVVAEGNHDVDIIAYISNERLIHASHHGSGSPVAPPALGKTLLTYVCPADRLEALLGDLDERFSKEFEQHGLRKARLWYWWQVLRSCGAFATRLLASVSLLYELLKRLGF